MAIISVSIIIYKSEQKINLNENVYKDYHYCHVKVSEEFDIISQYNKAEKSIKIPFCIYAYTESLFKIKHSCKQARKYIDFKKTYSLWLFNTDKLLT